MSTLNYSFKFSKIKAERSRWQKDSEMELCYMLHGAIMSSLSSIEYRLTRLSISISKIKEYHDVRDKPPFSKVSKIKYIRSVCNSEGPLKKYSSFLESIISRYEQYIDIRDEFAHGSVHKLVNDAFKLRTLLLKGGVFETKKQPYTMEEIIDLAMRVSSFSRALQRIESRALSSNILPDV